MSEVEQPQTPVEELSEIQQLRRQGKAKEAGGGAMFCVICEKKSYAAETVQFEKLPYHKDCFKCTKCSKKIEGGFNAAVFEYNLYCKSCFQQSGFNRAQAQVKWQKKEGAASTYNPAFANLGGGAQTCKACSKAVYDAEAQLFEKDKYHPDCLRCQEDGCGTLCTVAQLNKFEDKIYCMSCWNKGDYRRKQLAQTQNQPKASSSYNPAFAGLGGGAETCKVCEKPVYGAEAQLFEKEKYHPDCLRCQEDGCGVRCTVAQLNKFEEKIYCQSCWNKGDYRRKQLAQTQNQPKASSSYNPAFANLGGGAQTCKVCEKAVYDAEAQLFEKEKYHPQCLRCQEDGCGVLCTLAQLNKFEEKIYCQSCWNKGDYRRKQLAQAQNTPKPSGSYNPAFANLGGGGLKCKTCTKTVYPAETLLYEGNNYHPLCFVCTHCNQRIQNINSAQHNKKNPYCGTCFKELELYRADKC